MNLIHEVQKELKPADRPVNFSIGDTVKVHYKIKEGNRERIQVYEGVVIAMDNKDLNKTFTVRRVTYDIGVERVFPFYSTRIAKIELTRRGKSKRAKLYFLRERTGKSAKLKERMGTEKLENTADKTHPSPEPEKSTDENATS